MYLDAVERWRWSAFRSCSLHILKRVNLNDYRLFFIYLTFFSFFATFHFYLVLFLSFIRIIVRFLSFFLSISISIFFAFSLVYPAHINLSETILVHGKLLLSRDSLFLWLPQEKEKKRWNSFFLWFYSMQRLNYKIILVKFDRVCSRKRVGLKLNFMEKSLVKSKNPLFTVFLMLKTQTFKISIWIRWIQVFSLCPRNW